MPLSLFRTRGLPFILAWIWKGVRKDAGVVVDVVVVVVSSGVEFIYGGTKL